MILNLIIAMLAAATAVSLKAFQQLNVINRNTKIIPIVSFGLAAADVLLVSRIVSDGSISIIPMGIGGAIGCLLAIKLFDKIYKK